LQEARDHWHLQATVGLQGCIDVGLDEWLGGHPDRVPTLAELSSDALRHLREQQVLRADALTGAGVSGQGVVRTKDLTVEVIVPVAEAFLDLLAGRTDWDAATSPKL
jgi:hypothetical protein